LTLIKRGGEQNFADYLTAIGYPFEYEETFPHTRAKPDFVVRMRGETIVFDVKEFDAQDWRRSVGAAQYNPYKEIRRHIDYGREKFKDFDKYVCCVVLQNNGNDHVNIEDPATVLGSLYGDLGWEYPLSVGRGLPVQSPPKLAVGFGGNAQVHANKNTTISAVLTLRRLAFGRKMLVKSMRKHAHMEMSEAIEVAKNQYGPEFDPTSMPFGVIVWENAYARDPLSRDLFNGPFDERWGRDGNDITNVFSGPGLNQLLVP
jgi:Nuclease-related domain